MTTADEPGAPAAVPLLEPRGGIPDVVETAAALAVTVERFAVGTGPVAVDAERASGYRYSQRAYLVQLRREGAGTALVDPIACPDLSALSDALADAEWVLHAANQDLPSLAGVGMVPRQLFDTELAARIAGYERVGLATMSEIVLGHQLAKEHSAVDWSRRPLPEPWLAYAALDVEILVDLRNALEGELDRQGKLEWAQQEFAAILQAPPTPPRTDPWRRTSGIHRVRGRRQLAVVRALWEARDELARDRDVAPGRLLPDSAIVAAASAAPTTAEALGRLPGWGGKATRRLVPQMFPVVQRALALPDGELPRPAVGGDGPPPANRWPDRDPVAAERLARARAALAAVASQHGLPVENLLAPDLVRRLAWTPPAADPGEVAAALQAGGARRWQVELTAAPLSDALRDPDAAAPGG
ncbi:MAG TPA: HRDC domain-containing protein [Mycobacteriales bacterium]|nr:HRDC domain-containing protein [Mycobacteriales bacterium]